VTVAHKVITDRAATAECVTELQQLGVEVILV
jgi:hypothetical protein